MNTDFSGQWPAAPTSALFCYQTEGQEGSQSRVRKKQQEPIDERYEVRGGTSRQDRLLTL